MTLIKENVFIKTKYLAEKGDIYAQQYSNGTTAIFMKDCNTGEPLGVATVNITDMVPEKGHVWVRDYAEGEGMYQALRDLDVIEKAIDSIDINNGFGSKVYKCKLSESVLALINN